MNQSPSGGNKSGSMGPPEGLSRYGSAPGSFLSGLADSAIAGGGGGGEPSAVGAGSEGMVGRFFAGESSCPTSESGCRDSADGVGGCLQGSYRPGDLHLSAGGSLLVRHSSSPAGFFSHPLTDHGVSTTRVSANYSQTGTDSIHASANRRLRSQWSFSRDSLSQISELSIPEIGENDTCCNSSDEAAGHAGQSYISGNFQLGSWEDNNSIAFSAPPNKQAKDNADDMVTGLRNIASQFSFPRTSSEMSALEKYLQVQQDSVPCRVRAKRGCATHPRSIAERERRTRISKRLRKLQDIVPNMDKQTSTSDMLELAIQHIKELQSQVQKLKQEQANCTCPGKQEKAGE
ncbi:transcription factor bHLH128-like isoform X1 [Musa acuminata AAA Group]|uniref:transcription factor bHLH128-like isoform X1 n=1 Tax=Musa acuminata AAA Group TaxID=214697 RepID=UPI0031D73E16